MIFALIGTLFLGFLIGESAENTVYNVAIWYDSLPDSPDQHGFIDEDGMVFLTEFDGELPLDGQVIQVYYDTCDTATRLDDIPTRYEVVCEN